MLKLVLNRKKIEMIHFTKEAIYADTEEEKLDFYDRMHAGDPVILGHILLWELGTKNVEISTEQE